MSLLFAAALFVSAFLLFWVQPMVGKMVLPLLGGTPAVWNTCMLFFQGVLLAGYAYVLALTRWLSFRAQVFAHTLLLCVAALSFPIAVGGASAAGMAAHASPVAWLLKTLLLTVGLPFFALSASAPLLQKWFSRTHATSASDPYFLYAASNAGSFAALLGFPALVEPHLALGEQSRAWSLAYFALVGLVLACAATAWLRPHAATTVEDASREPEGLKASNEPEGLKVSKEPESWKRSGATGASAGLKTHTTELTARRRLRWVLLAFVPSSLVLGVTTYITTDLVAVPLLWVIPLALYLLSFVIVFARRRLLPQGLAPRLLPGSAVLLAIVYLSGATQPAWFLILFHLFFLFLAALVCHGRLAEERPRAEHLAEFYFWLAVGGVLGGLFNAVVAPHVFNSVVEYPLVILLASYLRPAFRRTRGMLLGLQLGAKGTEGFGGKNVEGVAGRYFEGAAGKASSVGHYEAGFGEEEDEGEDILRRLARDLLFAVCVGALAAALALVAGRVEMRTVERIAISLGIPLFLLNYFAAPRPLRFALGLGAVMLASALFSESQGTTLRAERNFFGTVRVVEESSGAAHWLRHGSTLHGRQFTDAARECEPLTYYHREGPLGSVFEAFHAKSDAASSVAVVGLGAGTTATYSRAGEAWTFYEIDPAIVSIARDPSLFTYLSKCSAAPVAIELGDARLRLRDAQSNSYDLIVLDAFTSDAIPAHLMTREALALYLSKLAPGGMIAFHVSNRTLDLERVVGGIAADAGLSARVFADKESEESRKRDESIGKDASTWVVVARRDEDLGVLASDARWQTFDASGGRLVLWRDDFTNVVSVFKWL